MLIRSHNAREVEGRDREAREANELRHAIEVHDLEHLREPFSDERFYDALRRTCRRVLVERLGQPRTTHDGVSALLAELRGEAPRRRDEGERERGVWKTRPVPYIATLWQYSVIAVRSNNIAVTNSGTRARGAAESSLIGKTSSVRLQALAN